MAFPAVQEAIETNTTTAGTSHVVTLPTPTAGQLLLIILDKGSTAATIDAHTELTELLDENLANGLYIAYRWMNGSEPASYTLTSSASTRTARIAYRISGAENPATQAPEIGTTSSGSSATPDPPASAAPGSTKDFLFIAFYGAAGEEADDDTWSDTAPTNYTPSPPRMKACGIAGTNLGGLLASAERQLATGAAENPGTFAKDTSAAWRAQTIMVHPTSVLVVEPSAIASTEVFGAAKELLTLLAVGAIPSVEAFGTLIQRLTTLPSAISPTEVFGAVTLSEGDTIAPSGIASAEAFGALLERLTLQSVGALASAEVFGAQRAAFVLAPSGLVSLEAFGTPRERLAMLMSGLASGEALGAASIPWIISAAGAIVSVEAFGNLSRPQPHVIGEAGAGDVTNQDKDDIRDRVLNAVAANHVTAGTIGKLLADVDTKTDKIREPRVVKGQAFSLSFVMFDDAGLPKAGLSVSAKISKDGGAVTATTNATSDVGSGVYYASLTATEMNADIITLVFTAPTVRAQAMSIATHKLVTA